MRRLALAAALLIALAAATACDQGPGLDAPDALACSVLIAGLEHAPMTPQAGQNVIGYGRTADDPILRTTAQAIQTAADRNDQAAVNDAITAMLAECHNKHLDGT